MFMVSTGTGTRGDPPCIDHLAQRPLRCYNHTQQDSRQIIVGTTLRKVELIELHGTSPIRSHGIYTSLPQKSHRASPLSLFHHLLVIGVFNHLRVFWLSGRPQFGQACCFGS